MQEVLAGFDFGEIAARSRPRSDHVVVSRDLADLRDPWINLEARADASAFQSYAWCHAWAEATAAAGVREIPYIVTVWQSDRLVLVWPLVMRRLGPLRVLESFGAPATQTADVLVEREGPRLRWIQAAWNHVRALGVDAVLLKGVRADAALAPFLALQDDAIPTCGATAPCADFSLDAAPIRHRSGRTRNALQRHQRNLSAAHGPVSLAVLTDPNERAEAMHSLLDLKQAWLLRTAQVSAGYAHPANSHFLPRLAREPGFVAYRLMAGRETAALEAGLLRNGRYWSLVQSYDERYAAHGPGRLLFWHLMERADALGITTFDFLAPATRHKSEWANAAVTVQDYVVPTRMRGRLVAFYIRSLRPRLKALLLQVRLRTKARIAAQRTAR